MYIEPEQVYLIIIGFCQMSAIKNKKNSVTSCNLSYISEAF